MAQSVLPGAGIARGGYIGVDIFFVLSGYIITSLLWRTALRDDLLRQYGRFLVRRVRRLYPALVGLVIVTMLIYALYPAAPQASSDLVLPGLVALVQGTSFYLASQAGDDSPFGITWSLSIEWMFYLLWPVAVLIAKRYSKNTSRLVVYSGGFAVVSYAFALTQDEHWFYFGPLARVPELLVGGILALVLAQSPDRQPRAGTSRSLHLAAIASLAAVAAYIVFGPAQWSPIFRYVGLPLAVLATVLLIWSGVRRTDALPSRILGWGPLPLVGRVSYSLYLWHELGFNLFTSPRADLPLPLAAALSVAATVLLTALSYRFLEMPFLKSRSDALARSELQPER
jgi:peptidoglycan/LPS O-acetylase OafA/YrhL